MTETYDPVEYWNARQHPNTKEDPGIREDHAQYLNKYISNARGVLEIGPGVGRLFSLYTPLGKVHTVDISKHYIDRLRQAAKDNNVSLSDHYLDSATSDFPFSDNQFSIGIASYVFLHVPFENIKHTMSEMARTCEKVVIMSGIGESWPKNEAERKPSSHCFNHDYEKICSEIGCEVVEHVDRNPGLAIVYQRK